MSRLLNKVCIITGAAQGIGESIARLFYAEGARVVITDIQDHKAQLVAESLPDQQRVSWAKVDVTSQQAIQTMVAATLARWGRIDVLVNNAGQNFYYDPLTITHPEWNACIQKDLTSVWDCCQSVLPAMLKQQQGSIVNIASVHGQKIIKGYFPYAVIKHAVLGLNKTLAIEYADRGIRVNAIAPGFIKTPATLSYLKNSANPQETERLETESIPLQRLGEPIEIAYTALFLASDESSFINAECIVADGGRSAIYNDLAATAPT